jgi:hypothetical protein
MFSDVAGFISVSWLVTKWTGQSLADQGTVVT